MTASRSTVYGSADGIAGSFRSHGRASLGTDHREAENTVIIANQELREACFSSVASVRRMALIGSFATRAHDAFALRLALAQSYMREQGIGEHAAPYQPIACAAISAGKIVPNDPEIVDRRVRKTSGCRRTPLSPRHWARSAPTAR